MELSKVELEGTVVLPGSKTAMPLEKLELLMSKGSSINDSLTATTMSDFFPKIKRTFSYYLVLVYLETKSNTQINNIASRITD